MKTHNLKLTDAQLAVIKDALKAYSRAQMGQFKIAFEQIFYCCPDKEYKEKYLKEPLLNWHLGNALENLLKVSLFKADSGFTEPHAGAGIGNVSEQGKIAYEVMTVIDQFLSVQENDGFWPNTLRRQFAEPLQLSKNPLPEIEGFQKFKDFPMPKEYTFHLRKATEKKDYKTAWGIVDQFRPKNVKGAGGEEIVEKNGGYYLRLYKPQKIEKEDE